MKAEHSIEMDMQAHNVLNQNIKEGFGLDRDNGEVS
jgi:hypothetical protein